MEMNEQTQLAWNIIETTNTNLFLTGKAGTGKTTFLRRLKQESSKRIIVVAPTGIAAINAEGTTIHSFFQLSFAPFIPDAQYKTKEQQYRFSKQKIRVIQSIDTLVIDEISMVRADLLDAVDAVLRRFRKNQLPFGGVQMVMIGDLGQLATAGTLLCHALLLLIARLAAHPICYRRTEDRLPTERPAFSRHT